jgi:sortase A
VTRRRLAAALVATVVAGAGIAVLAWSERDRAEDSGAAPSGAAPATTPATTAAAGVIATTPLAWTPATLPDPDRPPADPYADVPVRQIGAISIPAIGLDHPIYEGVWLTVLDHGPGHWPNSARPGRVGNAVFPGHRVTHSHPFFDLDRLERGDEVTFRLPDGSFTYAVTERFVVIPTDMWVTDPTPTATMTLIACHPKHSARQRIVVKGELVRTVPSAAARQLAADAAARLLRAAG